MRIVVIGDTGSKSVAILRQGGFRRMVQPLAEFAALRPRFHAPPVAALVGRRYGVMLMRDAPVAVHLAQAHGQPEQETVFVRRVA